MCAVDEEFDSSIHIIRFGGLSSLGIYLDLRDSRRHVPVTLPFRVFGKGNLHEISPNGEGGICSCKPELRAVVKAYPDDANQVGRKTGEPTVTGSPRLACNICFQTAGTNFGRRTTIHHVLHE